MTNKSMLKQLLPHLFAFAIVFSLGVFSQSQISAQSKPSTCNTTCQNGYSFNDNKLTTFDSCSQWANEACSTVNSFPESFSEGLDWGRYAKRIEMANTNSQSGSIGMRECGYLRPGELVVNVADAGVSDDVNNIGRAGLVMPDGDAEFVRCIISQGMAFAEISVDRRMFYIAATAIDNRACHFREGIIISRGNLEGKFIIQENALGVPPTNSNHIESQDEKLYVQPIANYITCARDDNGDYWILAARGSGSSFVYINQNRLSYRCPADIGERVRPIIINAIGADYSFETDGVLPEGISRESEFILMGCNNITGSATLTLRHEGSDTLFTDSMFYESRSRELMMKYEYSQTRLKCTYPDGSEIIAGQTVRITVDPGPQVIGFNNSSGSFTPGSSYVIDTCGTTVTNHLDGYFFVTGYPLNEDLSDLLKPLVGVQIPLSIIERVENQTEYVICPYQYGEIVITNTDAKYIALGECLGDSVEAVEYGGPNMTLSGLERIRIAQDSIRETEGFIAGCNYMVDDIVRIREDGDSIAALGVGSKELVSGDIYKITGDCRSVYGNNSNRFADYLLAQVDTENGPRPIYIPIDNIELCDVSCVTEQLTNAISTISFAPSDTQEREIGDISILGPGGTPLSQCFLGDPQLVSVASYVGPSTPSFPNLNSENSYCFTDYNRLFWLGLSSDQRYNIEVFVYCPVGGIYNAETDSCDNFVAVQPGLTVTTNIPACPSGLPESRFLVSASSESVPPTLQLGAEQFGNYEAAQQCEPTNEQRNNRSTSFFYFCPQSTSFERLDSAYFCRKNDRTVSRPIQIRDNVLGATDEADEPDTRGLTITETGRYAFFAEGNKIAESDVLVSAGRGDARVILFEDTNGDGIRQVDEKIMQDHTQIAIAKEASAEEFTLTAGWNLIHLPLIDTRTDGNVDSAGELIDYWNGQGADIKHVARYRNGQFQMFSKRESGTEYSIDFDLIPGEGLFVLNLTGNTTVTFSGNRFESSLPVRLNQGWNLVGLMAPSKSYNSEQVLASMQTQGFSADTISQFEGGSYQSLISKDDTIFGNNFNITDKRGYFVRVESGGGQSFDPGK